MKIRKKIVILAVLIILFIALNMGLYILCKMFFHSQTLILSAWIVLFTLEGILAAGGFVANRYILATEWFQYIHADYDHERYPDNIWYRNHDERNYQLVNLGSYAAKFAFDYSDAGVRAMNWSSGVQTLIDDYKLVQNFHSILKENGTIIIVIMPFTSVNKRTGIMESFKFHNTFGWELTEPEYRERCRILERFPIFFGIRAMKVLVKAMMGKSTVQSDGNHVENTPMPNEELKKDAHLRIVSWKKEFSIENLEDNLTPENREGRKIRIQIMRELIDFIQEREYRAVWVIPPVSEYLSAYFTDQFKEQYIYNYLKQVDRDILLLDYLADKDFRDRNLYFNSYFLNQRGAKLFTRRVMADLRKIERL